MLADEPLRDSQQSGIIDMAAISNIKDIDINELEISDHASRMARNMGNKTQIMQKIQ